MIDKYVEYKIAREVCETLHCDFYLCDRTTPVGCPKHKELEEMCDIMCNGVEEDE